MSRDDMRVAINGLAPGESAERDLSWLDFSLVKDLSADGRTLKLFAWLTLAMEAGHKDSTAALQSLEAHLGAEERRLAQKLAREWKTGQSIPDVASDER